MEIQYHISYAIITTGHDLSISSGNYLMERLKLFFPVGAIVPKISAEQNLFYYLAGWRSCQFEVSMDVRTLYSILRIRYLDITLTGQG